MTDLRKTVKRRTVNQCATVRRRLVVALESGDVLAIREEGRRRWFRAPIARVFVTVAQWNVAADRAAKKAERKAKRRQA